MSIDDRIAPAAAARFLRLVEKRRRRVPLAYLTGEREFWSLSFRVFPGVLIPRSDTECLVESAVRRSSGEPETIVDLGTGSGCVAIALSRELPAARIFAVDRSRRALRAARFNADRHSAASVTWLEGDFFAPLPGRIRARNVDMIVSNPPYIADAEWRRLAPEVREHEPKRALAAGPDGLDFIRRLASDAGKVLRPGGWLIFEIGAGQAGAAAALFGEEWGAPSAERDLAGIPRVISVQRRL
jgi:release factor glutamine methyltransferase